MATQGQWISASAQLLEAAPKQLPLIPIVTVARGSPLMKKIIHFPLLQQSFSQLSGLFCWTWGLFEVFFPTISSNWECQVWVHYKFFFYYRNQTIAAKVSTFPNLLLVILIVKTFFMASWLPCSQGCVQQCLFPFVPPFHLTAISP